MKRLIVALFALSSAYAMAIVPYAPVLWQRNPTNTGNTATNVPLPATDQIFYWDSTATKPILIGMDSTLSIVGGKLSASGAVGPQGPAGDDGKSAYELAVETGFVGTELQWLASLKGDTGPQGPQGNTGATGPAGAGITSITPATRAFGTAFTVSATRPAFVSYTVTTAATNPLLAGTSSASVDLQYSTNGGTTWVTLGSAATGLSVGLAVSITLTNTTESTLAGFIPAGAQVRLVSATTGTGSTSYLSGQETLL